MSEPYEKFCSCIVRHLDEVLEQRAKEPGAKKALRQQLGVGASFFGDLRRRRGRLPVDKVLDLVDLMGLDGLEFVITALSQEPRLDVLPSDSEDFGTQALIELARKCFETTGAQGDPSRGFWKYKVLERMRSEAPRRCIGLVRVAMPHVHRSFLPYLLGVHGSALRALNQYEQAIMALDAGAELARDLKDLSAQANMKRREAYVWFEQGNLEASLRLAVEAGNKCDLAGNSIGKGRCLVDQGRWLHHQGEFCLSLKANKAALRLLPLQERDHRFSAMLGNAYNFEQCADLSKAWIWTELASHHRRGISRSLEASFFYLRGRLAKRRADYVQSAKAYKEAFDFFFQREMYLDAAEAAIELCEAYLLSGREDLARATAESSMALIGRLRNNRVAAATIVELGRSAVAGKTLSLNFLERSRRSLRLASSSKSLQ